ncbi:MAG: sigma-70 family RNA polymerase sigma factor [Candidatus Yonathbacteria bacterium]|nr:sigma-70 family RNA polymerase sigma factor [Candidatus Yonathbacteria bacterium]
MKPNAIEKEFIKTYDQFADAIFRHCVFRVSDREKAKDITQGTFVRLWDYMSQGKEIDNMRAFLYRIANNLVIDEYRRKKDDSLDRMRDEEGFDIGFESMKDIETKDEYARAQALLKCLPDKYREALVMRHIDGLSVKDIAHLTHESENVVSVRIHRAIEKLKMLSQKNETHN